MDNVYIMSRNKSINQRKELNKLLDIIFENRYLLSIAGYYEKYYIPYFKIKKEEKYIDLFGNASNPTIWMDPFDESYIYERDGNFPILLEGNEYFPFIDFKCRESFFMLEFLVYYIRHNPEYLICNVNNYLMNLEELETDLKNKNYNWMYSR